MTTNDQIQSAIRLHQSGDLAAAEKIYRQILAAQPNNPDALHLLGVLAGQCGNVIAAIDLLKRAIAHQSSFPQAQRNLAALLAQAGRFNESVEEYRAILAAQPNDAAIHRELGSVLGASGRFDEAADSLSNAIRLNPADAAACNELGGVRRTQGRFDDAISACSRAIALQADFAEAHQNLGASLRAKGMAGEALAEFRRAIELKPNLAESHFNIAEIHRLAARSEEALAAYRRAIELKPDYVQAYNNSGNLLQDLGRLDEAIAAYLMAVKLQPDNPSPYFNLGKTYQAASQFPQAVAAYEKTIAKNPDHLEAHANMAVVLAHLHRFDEAAAAHKKAAALSPDAAITHLAMGEILLRKSDPSAPRHFRRAVEADPQMFAAWNGLGASLQAQGSFDEAADCFRRMLQLQPASPVAHQNLFNTNRFAVAPDEIAKLKSLLDRPALSPSERMSAGFALAKVLDDADRFDEAFPYYQRANELAKNMRAAAGEIYDPAAFHGAVDQIIETFTPEFFRQRRDWGEASELPVFIVGMPRSGTSLVQQIAASHPDIYGAGELTEIQRTAETLGEAQVANSAMNWTAESVHRAARAQLQRFSKMAGPAERIIDKLPNNILFLGLIAVLFPKSRVIFCRRDPRDVCLSCYFQCFATGNTFSFDLAHCGHRHVEIDRLAAHWLKVLPLRMIEVQYEAVIADLESQSRRLIDFLGLPWDPACLEFYRTQNTVLTASVWQVRQPIYSRSVGRWRHYKKHLQPLLTALGT